jgi:hypothetical protein
MTRSILVVVLAIQSGATARAEPDDDAHRATAALAAILPGKPLSETRVALSRQRIQLKRVAEDEYAYQVAPNLGGRVSIDAHDLVKASSFVFLAREAKDANQAFEHLVHLNPTQGACNRARSVCSFPGRGHETRIVRKGESVGVFFVGKEAGARAAGRVPADAAALQGARCVYSGSTTPMMVGNSLSSFSVSTTTTMAFDGRGHVQMTSVTSSSSRLHSGNTRSAPDRGVYSIDGTKIHIEWANRNTLDCTGVLQSGRITDLHCGNQFWSASRC